MPEVTVGAIFLSAQSRRKLFGLTTEVAFAKRFEYDAKLIQDSQGKPPFNALEHPASFETSQGFREKGGRMD